MADIDKISADIKSMMDEPTDVVPPKTDYDLNYEPSKIGGLATLAGVGGAAAYFLNRAPGIGRVARTFSTKIPRVPDARTTDKVVNDQVDEILTITPTRMDRARDTIQASRPADPMAEAAMQIKKAVDTNPLSVAGTKTRFGSAAFDFIAKHPSKKPLKPEAWINEFSSEGRMGQLKVPNTNIRANITREELEETNIAKFDKDGKIIGGFLKIAQDKNIPVSKFDLLEMIQKSPALNLKTKRHFYVGDMDKKTDTAVDLFVAKATAAKNKLASFGDEFANDISRINGSIADAKSMKSLKQAQVTEGVPDIDSPTNIKEMMNGLVQLSDKVKDRKGLELITRDEAADLLKSYRNMNRAYDLNKTQGSMPKYGDQYSYRERGGEKYFEDVVYYPKEVPFGLNYTGGHYSGIKNQVVHTRYAMRSLQDNPNKKVYAIDEIQSDYSRSLEDAGKVGQRLNPFNVEQEYVFYSSIIKNKVKEMKALTDKGLKMTQDDIFEAKKLDNQIEELKKTTVNAFNMNNKQFRELPPYLPMLERAQYNDYAVKNLLKQAADDGIEWVVVNPTERIHVALDLTKSKNQYGKLGNWNAYGAADGRAGIKGVKAKSQKRANAGEKDVTFDTNYKMMASVPETFKKLAKQYNSETRMIKVSKSDPNKPYKVVEEIYDDEAVAKKLGLTGAQNERHIAAFRTEEEAKALRAGQKVIKFIDQNDPDNYYYAFGIKITPEMKGTPFKLYRREGGLVVNLFA